MTNITLRRVLDMMICKFTTIQDMKVKVQVKGLS